MGNLGEVVGSDLRIKEVLEALNDYAYREGRPKFADVFVYACLADYVEEFQSDTEYDLKEGTTVESVWSAYLASDTLITLENGYNSASEWARDWFSGEFATLKEESDDE